MKTNYPWKSFLKKIAVIAVPVALQNLLTTTGSMVDTMMIASLGQTEVGAVGLCAQFSSLMFACYWGFVGGGMLFFSQFWGAKDDEGINRSYGLTLTCMMTVGLVFGLLAICFPETVMRMYTDKEPIQRIGTEYLRIAGFAYPLIVFSMAMAALLRCTGKVRIPLWGSVAGVCTNIFLNWVLIFGRLGAPAMGVRGAALATVIAQAVSCLVVLVAARRSGHRYLLAVSRHFRWSRRFVSVYLKKCFPIICNEVLIGLGNMVINIVLGRQPEEAIAALAVLRTLEGLVIGFFAGFSNASSVLVGTEVRCRTAGRGIRACLATGVPVPGLYRTAGSGSDCPAHSDPDCDGNARGELPAGFRYAGDLPGSRADPDGKLDPERHLQGGGGRDNRNGAGNHLYVADGAALRLYLRTCTQMADPGGVRPVLCG